MHFDLHINTSWDSLLPNIEQDDLNALEVSIDVIIDDANVTWFCDREPLLPWIVSFAQGVARLNQHPTGKMVQEFACAPWHLAIVRHGQFAYIWLYRRHPALDVKHHAKRIKWKHIAAASYKIVKQLCATLKRHHIEPPSRLQNPLTIRPQTHRRDAPDETTTTLTHTQADLSLRMEMQHSVLYHPQDDRHPWDTQMLMQQGLLKITHGDRALVWGSGYPLWDVLNISADLETQLPSQWFDVSAQKEQVRLVSRDEHGQQNDPLPLCITAEVLLIALQAFALKALNHIAELEPPLTDHPWIREAIHALRRIETTQQVHLRATGQESQPTTDQPEAPSHQPTFPWPFSQTLALYPATSWTWRARDIVVTGHNDHTQELSVIHNNGLTTLDMGTGEPTWHLEQPHIVNHTRQHAFHLVQTPTTLYTLDNTGQHHSTHRCEPNTHLISATETHLMWNTRGHLSCWHHATGEQVWARAIPDHLHLVEFDGNSCLILGKHTWSIFDAQSGELIAEMPANGVPLAGFIKENDWTVFSIDNQDLLYTTHNQRRHQTVTIGPSRTPQQILAHDDSHYTILTVTAGYPMVRVFRYNGNANVIVWQHTMAGPPREARAAMIQHEDGQLIVHQPSGDVVALDDQGDVLWQLRHDGLGSTRTPPPPLIVRDGVFLCGASIQLRQRMDGRLLHTPNQLVDPPQYMHATGQLGLLILEHGGSSTEADLLYRIDFGHFLALAYDRGASQG